MVCYISLSLGIKGDKGVFAVSRKSSRTSDAKAFLAITELIQCKLLSSETVAYVTEVRDMLQKEIQTPER